eukprot:gene5356-532_t
MAHFLEFLDQEEIEKSESSYNTELQEGGAKYSTQFHYASCLVRSRYRDDIRKGIEQFNDLCRRKHCDQGDFLFYLALAYYKLGDYEIASKYTKRLISSEPENSIAKELDDLINEKTTLDGLMGLAVVGGVLALGGALLGMLFSKK